jgi:hypothetical protein
MANRAPAAAGHPRLRRWRNQALLALALIAVLAGIYLIGRAFLPRWWAHRIGDQVGGSIAAGIALGLFYGFVFTLLPIVVLWRGFRRRRPWRYALGFAIVAVLLASPNLVTLGTVLGTGNAAHAGERTLDVEAPAYRTSVLIGAITAVAVFAFLYYLLFSRRLARGRVAKLRERLRVGEAEQDRTAAAEEPGTGDR